MKVFGSKFLEQPSNETVLKQDKWSWKPVNNEIDKIYGSGANTNTRSSTYAAETDDRSDSDSPQEGMLAA